MSTVNGDSIVLINQQPRRPDFNYGALDPGIANEAKAAADRIRTFGAQHVETIHR